MVKQVIWSTKASKELFDILEFWNSNNLSTTYSKNLYQKIQINIKYISENNFIGKSSDIEGVRVVVISNYLLSYQISEKYIEILSLFDGRRNPEDLSIK
jgi:plasmid stabilization system protein ParE